MTGPFGIRGRARPLRVGLAVSGPCAAATHGMGTATGYKQALQSMLDSVWSPIMLLALVGYGVLAGTSGASRAKLVAGFVLSGLGAGIAAAPWFSPFGAFSALIVGVVCSGQSAASLANPPKFMLPALGFAVGITATLYNLDGHPVLSLPFPVYFGLVLGPFALAMAVTWWIVVILQDRGEDWVRIIFRIVSSWSFAANAIYLAFQIKSAGL